MLALRLGAIVLAAAATATACSSSETGNGGGGQGGSSSSAGAGLAGGGASTSSGPDAGPPVCTSGFTTIPKGDCDLLTQNCPAGQTCRPDDDTSPNESTCIHDTGLKGLGQDCKAHEECQAGLICVNQCTAACCRSNNEPCGGGQCNLQLNYDNGEYLYVCQFNKSCKLLQPEACPDTEGCHVDDATVGLASCTKPSPHPVKDLDKCVFLNDCPAMEDCHDEGGTAGKHCHFYCYTEMSRGQGTPGLGGCPGGQSCVTTINGMAIDEGLPGIGLCVPN